MAPRRNNSRLGHTRSVSCANENVPIHSLIGPQRSKPVLLNKSNRSGLPSSSNLSNSSNLKDSSHKHSSSLGNPNLSTRRVLGDVSNAIKVLGSSKPSIGSDLKTSIQAKPSKVRKVASQTSLDQSKPIGISSTISKGLNLGNSATFGGNAGKKLVESLKSRASASTLKNTSCSDSSSSSIISKRKSIQKSISESGSILTWSNLDSNLIPQDDQNQFEILNDHQINSQNLDHLIHLEIPSNQIINHHHHHHHDMIIDEEHLNTNHHHSNHQSLDQVKINLPDTVFAQAEAENLANQSDHEDDDHQIGQSSTNQLYDSIPTYHSIDSDENELSLCRNHLEDQEINQSLDHDNWLLLLPDEEIESKRIIEAIKKEFQEELDYWDATMVAEYSEEIFKYMQELEESTLPNPRYMESQTEIEWDMRTTLIDWLLQVHMRYHMLPETLWIAVNIIDRFLSKRVVSLVKFQLVGVTAMFVAAKYEEIMAPSVEEFVYMTENGYTRDEILKGEKILLTTLDFKISSYCSPYSWLRRISKADDYDIQTRTLSKFLMELTLLDYRFLRAKSSMIAAIGMFTARKMLGGDWSDAFVYYSGYTETQLITPMSFLIEFLSTDGFEDRFVYKKYANRKFLKASIFARNQALKRTRQDESQNSDF